jgi:D-serine deaminase-like pyridoxal phosphate-dependent protein
MNASAGIPIPPVAADAGRWARYRRALAGQTLPVAFVDLDAVDANIDRLVAPARAAHKALRIATKSLRSPARQATSPLAPARSSTAS